MTAVPKTLDDHRRGRGGRGVRVDVQPLRHQGDGHRDAAAHRAGGGRGSLEGTGAGVQEAEDPRRDGREVREHPEDRQRREDDGDAANGKRKRLEAEKLLVAVGRAPNTAKIGLENTKVEVDRGFIKVDEYQQTAEPGVYAIGDVVAGTPQLAHVATAQGMIAVAHMAGKPAVPINRNRIPGCTYTEPGIGSVGLTEAQARAAGLQGEGRASFRSRATAGRPFWASTTASSRWWRTRSTARFWASTSSGRRPSS